MTVGFGPWDMPRRMLRMFAESTGPKARGPAEYAGD